MEQAEQQVVYPPNDLIRECFSFLPVKDVIRNRMLSQDFNSMLTDNSFVDLHRFRSAKNKILVKEVYGSSYLRYFEKTDDGIKDNIDIDGNMNDNTEIYGGFQCDLEPGWLPVTSCHGIVCCIKRVRKRIYEEVPRERQWIPHNQFHLKMQAHLYAGEPHPLAKVIDRRLIRTEEGYQFRFENPATREFSPISALLDSKTACRNPLIGFGFDHIHSVYKLVVLLPAGGGRVLTRVFDLGSNEWRTVNQSFPGTPLLNTRDYGQIEFIKNGAFLNGSLNWLALSGNILICVCFDLAAETYSRKNLPRNTNIKNPNIGVLNNRISFTYFSKGSRSFKIWRQEQEDNDGWMQLARIGLQELSMSDREYESFGVPLLLIDISNTNTLVLVRTRHRNSMVFYNFTEQAVVGSHEFEAGRITWVDDSSFVESLVSP
ncbi:F-box/kelch-repeat protein [Trifolium repens]|jgi:F-box interacting protein|nr:F-box/kelch-repeat protein [Trifolium repens]